jgi:hypothetical protein
MNTTATVNNGSPIIENSDITPVTCNGGSNGSINLNVTGGNPTYTYNWSNGITNESNTTLSAGTYDVQITDANGCITSGSYDITEPTSIDLNPLTSSDFGNNDGSIDLNVVGGTPGYTYTWSNGETTEDLSNLSAGTYTVTVTDNNGCSAEVSTEVLNESTANQASLQNITLNIFPNPAQDFVKISWKGPGAKLTIVKQNGQEVLSRIVQSVQAIQLVDLASGYYLVTIKSTNGSTVTRQLVVL